MKSHPLAAQCLSTRRAEGITCAAALLALTVQASGAEAILVDKAKQFFKPLPQDMATTEFPTLAPRVELGKNLFFNPRSSADGTVEEALKRTDFFFEPFADVLFCGEAENSGVTLD